MLNNSNNLTSHILSSNTLFLVLQFHLSSFTSLQNIISVRLDISLYLIFNNLYILHQKTILNLILYNCGHKYWIYLWILVCRGTGPTHHTPHNQELTVFSIHWFCNTLLTVFSVLIVTHFSILLYLLL